MATRYYLPGNVTPETDKVRKFHFCAECGEWLAYWWDKDAKKAYLACHRHNVNRHEGIARTYKQPDYNDQMLKIGKEEMMSTEVMKRDQELTKRGLPLTGLVTQSQATEILKTVWKGAPEDEVYKAAMICADFGLHPLMNHVYLIKYDRYNKDRQKIGEDWATVLGIGATRQIYANRNSFTYLDDTPRIMSEAEQTRIFGEVDKENWVAITKLCNSNGNEAQGYGKWPRKSQPYGTDKGNSGQNMAMIRSERAAFKRLDPGVKMPDKVDVMDEAFINVDKEAGELPPDTIEGEVIEKPAITNSPGNSEAKQENTEAKTPGEKPAPQPKAKRDPDTIKNFGELYMACQEDFGLKTRKDVWKELGVSSQEAISDKPCDCYRKILMVKGG